MKEKQVQEYPLARWPPAAAAAVSVSSPTWIQVTFDTHAIIYHRRRMSNNIRSMSSLGIWAVWNSFPPPAPTFVSAPLPHRGNVDYTSSYTKIHVLQSIYYSTEPGVGGLLFPNRLCSPLYLINPNPSGWGHIWLPKLWEDITPQRLK